MIRIFKRIITDIITQKQRVLNNIQDKNSSAYMKYKNQIDGCMECMQALDRIKIE